MAKICTWWQHEVLLVTAMDRIVSLPPLLAHILTVKPSLQYDRVWRERF